MELRKDYILDRYVIVSSARGKRPHEFKREAKIKEGICYFCPGNEKLTPPEIGRIGTKNKWTIRWFPNKFPAVDQEGSPDFETHNKYYTFAHSYGYHEVIAETDNHKKQMWDLTPKQIKKILEVYADRIEEISKKDNIKYVSLFKNHGKDAGTSIVHSHTQIIAYNKIPSLVKEEVDAAKNYSTCPYCEIIENESKSERRCFENSSFVAFAPYASRFHYEIWIFPKQHIKNMTELTEDQLNSLAQILKKVLLKLKKLNISYNMQLHYAPKGQDLHSHIEICPREAIWGGFELLTDDTINSVSPEDAAKYYRGNK
ncbi:galactose-1-phosphate uridylyltransferase [Candidatus Woesearchaeota archaeon]|nr:galactose-1-phosphate uridylyltransferase [Candidatus Woesearchaeota archaeon]